MKINCNTPTRVGSSLGHDTTCEGQGASTYRPERTEGLCKDTETRVPRCYTHTPPTHRYTHTYTHIFLGAPGCTPRSAVSEVTHPPADHGRPCLASLPRGPLEHRPHEILAPPCWGGACAIRPISSAGAWPVARGRWRTPGAAWRSGPRFHRWAGGPGFSPRPWGEPGACPGPGSEGSPAVTRAVPRRLRTGRWTGGAGSRRVRRAGHMRGLGPLGADTARCLTPGAVLRPRES